MANEALKLVKDCYLAQKTYLWVKGLKISKIYYKIYVKLIKKN